MPTFCARSNWSRTKWLRRSDGARRLPPTWRWSERGGVMSTEPKDVIDHFAGIAPGSNLDIIRARRQQARDNAQKSYLSLFAPADFGDVPAADRHAVAAFVAGLHGEPAVTAFYLANLAGRSELVDALKAEIERGRTKGPYGAFPAGPLSAENTTGLIYRVADDRKAVLGAK